MSVNLTSNDIASFASDCKDAYQGQGMLRDSVRVVTGITGSTHRFHKIGKGLAQPRIPQTEVVPMGIGHSNATATLTDWHAAEYTDIFDEQKVNYSERQFLASTTGRAITRREDQMIIDALDAGTYTAANQVAVTVGGNNGLNMSKIRQLKRKMDDAEIPAGDRTLIVTPTGIDQMLAYESVVSSDYSNLRRLQDGEMGNGWMGFNWKVLPSAARAEGGLTGDGSTTLYTYAYHKPAVGLANGMELSVAVDYIPQYTSTLTNAKYIGGATIIDNEGVFEVIYDDTATGTQLSAGEIIA